MKRLVVMLACTAFMFGLTACNSEPKHELWKQYQSAEEPGTLFADVSVEEMVLSEDGGYKLTLTEATSSKSEKYDGFCFGVFLEKDNEEDLIYTFSEVKINGVEVSTKHSSYMAMKEVGLPYYPGEIVFKYEDLARNNISAIENVSCVMEVYEAVIEDEKQEDGVNATYLERGDLLYTSPEITFEVHEVE